ncbi:PIN domain-containing protein [uncultured Leifsonia sp.]|uniref:PIN domain-containing protein n=1 Tax=uncultured Leifsonia sp. TaxID=340359 RepID=UPI0025EBC082|nr:PIN domain-containing protein [uncultured Leifsonia sp.]
MPFRVFIDANVLVPGRWRDIVLTLAEAEVCEVLWSGPVLEEVARHLPDTMTVEDREFLFEQMNAAFPDALVAWPGAVDVEVRSQVNEKDRHVVAAALWGHAEILLTEDATLHDEVLASGLLDAQHMPVFLAYAIDSAPRETTLALVEMARRRWLRDPFANEQDVLGRLRNYFDRQGWPAGSLTR